MQVYQLKILELGEYLEPVFKTKESALNYREKYKGRNIIVKEKIIGEIKDDIVYRIKNCESDGYTLEYGVYSNYEEASLSISKSHQIIIESRLN